MRRSATTLLILIVVLPVTLLAWAGARISQQQHWQAEQQIRELLTGRLSDIDRGIAEHFSMLAADLQRLTAFDHYDTESLREIARRDPRILQLFVIDPQDVLIHPNPDGPLLQGERDFILRAAPIINDRQLQRIAAFGPGGDPGDENGKTADAQTQNADSRTGQASGWFPWYWGPGLNLIYWQRRTSGHIVAMDLARSRWIADLIAELPDTPSLALSENSPASQLRIRLVEAGGETVYEWGHFAPPETEQPAGEIRLSDPLSAWQLRIFAPMALLTRSAGYGTYFNLAAGLTIAGVALTALAVIFYQQYARDMREAGRRVSFVNQVSHELKTPLTNIRMYAELIEKDLDGHSESTSDPRRRIGVIVTESERLSRLIENVLTFARQERHTSQLKRQRLLVDDVIRKVLSRFQTAMDHKNIVIESDLQATEECLVDADALEQILGNLISNVEKYAASGMWMKISSRQQGERTTITVADRGPGIAASQQKHVFEPFWRGSDEISHASGTGIGLTIARHLARLHGGDVTLESTTAGTTFHVELTTLPATGGNR